jgi:hypothetical protein
MGSGLALFSLLGLGVFFGVRTRKKFIRKVSAWVNTMKIDSSETETAVKNEQDKVDEP